MKEISPKDLEQKLEQGTVTLIDVREPDELEICKIDQAINIPLSQFEGRYEEVSKEGYVVVMCRSGGRSGRAIELLESKGYTNLANLKGGILAWADDVDQSLEKY